MAVEWIPKDIKGNDVDLSIYKGKVLLVINVASKCGLTNSNYDELNQLYQNYKDQVVQFVQGMFYLLDDGCAGRISCVLEGEEEESVLDSIVLAQWEDRMWKYGFLIILQIQFHLASLL
ncbi:unnamed protein product [Malus baccata var. baccata]